MQKSKKSLFYPLAFLVFFSAVLAICLANVQAKADSTAWLEARDYSGTGPYYTSSGTYAKNTFLFDGRYTYYMQADGTPMTNRLTYHPNGQNTVYFDKNGHEVFNSFQDVEKGASGNALGYTCYFDANGYLYQDEITSYNGKTYYLDGTGKMKKNEWFRFDNGADIGYAKADGSLHTEGFGADPWGRQVFYHWNGMVAPGLITDGAWYYNFDLSDGHFLGKFAASAPASPAPAPTPAPPAPTPAPPAPTPDPTPAPPAPTPAPEDPKSLIAQVVVLVNKERAANGLSPLTVDTNIESASAVRAEEISRLFDHKRPDGRSCFTALDEAGVRYSGAGENIAAGQRTPEAVMKSWMDSPGHRANILNSNFTRIGVGYFQSSSGYRYNWVQLFAK
ncbi:hypothetical protein FACS1894111_12940 [Clostridia bacterium]|nr:hypothetical protein FACS1894111_12940 [Clostridia bacterium]